MELNSIPQVSAHLSSLFIFFCNLRASYIHVMVMADFVSSANFAIVASDADSSMLSMKMLKRIGRRTNPRRMLIMTSDDLPFTYAHYLLLLNQCLLLLNQCFIQKLHFVNKQRYHSIMTSSDVAVQQC